MLPRSKWSHLVCVDPPAHGSTQPQTIASRPQRQNCHRARRCPRRPVTTRSAIRNRQPTKQPRSQPSPEQHKLQPNSTARRTHTHAPAQAGTRNQDHLLPHVWHPRVPTAHTLHRRRYRCPCRSSLPLAVGVVVMTVSIKRMSAGDGYRYLMRSVVVGDGNRDVSSPLTRYYTESGNPPGRWMGSGLAGLDHGRGLTPGTHCSEQQMFRLFGMGDDPVSGERLGSRPYRIATNSGRSCVAGFDLTFSAAKSVNSPPTVLTKLWSPNFRRSHRGSSSPVPAAVDSGLCTQGDLPLIRADREQPGCHRDPPVVHQAGDRSRRGR
jgi:TrwC relaxase